MRLPCLPLIEEQIDLHTTRRKIIGEGKSDLDIA